MKRVLRLSIFLLMVAMLFPNKGTCLWPFDRDDEAELKEIIQEYKQFEKMHDYSDKMLKKIKKVVKGTGKKNLPLRMAYMRLRYYRAVEEHDQSMIQEVSNEAESLLKGDHPLFREQIRENEVRKYLLALKEARYNEKRGTSWKALIISIIVFGLALGGGFAASSKGEGPAIVIGAGIGSIGGFVFYFLLLKHIFYKMTVVYSNLPPVPLVG